jgi:membrane associated rhomboid family serine protease
MYLVVPISHDDMRGRRWPIVTTVIIAACFFAFVATLLARSGSDAEVSRTGKAALEYYAAHPYLRPKPPLDGVVARYVAALPPPKRDALQAALAAPTKVSDIDRGIEQSELDVLTDELADALDATPTRRFGYVPAENNVLGLFTYAFMHGGWAHLVFNMWFLWLCGCNLEDRWGRLVFVPFYVTAGVVAALAHKLAVPDSNIPIVGASGAVAAAMGAFLVSFARTKIRFFYAVWLIVRIKMGTFAAPAFVILPLWLGGELLWGVLGRSDGVAHWAHVGGFAFGAVVALVLKATGAEKKLDDAVETRVTVRNDPRLTRAAELIDGGRSREAILVLDAFARESPRNADVWLELLRAAKEAGDRDIELRAYARLIVLYLDLGMLDAAFSIWEEARLLGVGDRLASGARARLASELSRTGTAPRALVVFESIARSGISDEAAARAVLAGATLAATVGRRDQARPLFEAVQRSPFATLEMSETADREIAELGPAIDI